MDNEKRISLIQGKGVLFDKLRYLDEFLLQNDLNITLVCHADYEHIQEIAGEKGERRTELLVKVASYFKLDVTLLEDDSIDVSSLPPYSELSIDRKIFKVRQLHKYLLDEHELELYRAISYKKEKLEEVLQGKVPVTNKLLSRIGAYFSLPSHFLINDSEDIPLDKIKLDENLLSIQKEDVANEMKKVSNRRSFKRNWNVLGYKKRVKLILTSLLIIIPLVAYTVFCATILISDRVTTSREFLAEQTLSQEQQQIYEYQDALLKEKGKEKYQVEVNIGISVANIKNVSNSGMSFSPTVEVFFDFDHEDYFRMIYNHENNSDFDERNTYLLEEKYQHDDFGYNLQTGEFFKHSDNIPDYMQIEGYAIDDRTDSFYCTSYKDFVDVLYTTQENGHYLMSDDTWDRLNIDKFEMSQIYAKVISQYPGETTSNVYPDKDGLFSVGHYSGSFDADEFSYGLMVPYTLTDDEGNVTYRFFQSLSFSATISKVYTSPRYPLDSVSFTIPITAEKLTYEYLKYVPVDYVDLTSDQRIRNNDPANDGKKYTCSLDANVFTSGTNPGFKISTGYKLFNSGDIKDISKKVVLRYFTDSDSDSQEIVDMVNDPKEVFYYSEYQLIMHANRSGISLFLQAFINLFAVVIWIVIAFYDQSYHNESAIGMLGTGLFGAISSILVGLSMISEAGIFSLITMINIFTLAVILIMTVASINAKRAKIMDDKAAIAYNSVKMRILFVILTLCTLMMFVGLPFASYIFY